MLALLLAILSSPILGAPLATADTPVTMVVTGGTLIDGTGRDPLADSAILIRNGRVDAVSTGSMCSIPSPRYATSETVSKAYWGCVSEVGRAGPRCPGSSRADH